MPGRVHFNGGDTNQANYTLDGFNISDPVTGRLETRVNIDTIQSMDLENSRFSAENGRGSTGVLDLKTKMGDDRFRFGGTNFIPGVTTDSGVYINKWTPRLEFSGPLAKGRAWFHNGFDAFYNMDTVSGLPRGREPHQRAHHQQPDPFPVQYHAGKHSDRQLPVQSGLYQPFRAEHSESGGATTDQRQQSYMSTMRDQHYFGGALLDVGFADTRGLLRNPPQGDLLFQITPLGNRGNYFSAAWTGTTTASR